MKSIKVQDIQGLAQDFLKAPRISMDNSELRMVYDYEMDSGDYGERTIVFEDAKEHKHVHENEATPDMIKAAYNAIAEIIDSDLISKERLSEGYKHYLIYFDGFGTYEIIAKNVRIDQ